MTMIQSIILYSPGIVLGFILAVISLTVGPRIEQWSGPKTIVKFLGIVLLSTIAVVYTNGQYMAALSLMCGLIIGVTAILLFRHLKGY
ncbi:hypothetical protein GCM10009039_10100 [Halocalculus aciditolerans]|uniref:Uncharacterized protein n=1 Tax=Halocalculus aciditolerans TaxID=1383812 RepID=A0A830FA10_9EURY|nr:hypothetical protein GCM10009039_10100 [Halocalculus aciditolerans]